MTERKRGKGSERVGTQVTEVVELTAEEEKVLTMRKGYRVRDEHPLGQVGQRWPDVAAKLRAIELRALEKSGRLEELRAEAGLEAAPTDASAKSKIIDRLKH